MHKKRVEKMLGVCVIKLTVITKKFETTDDLIWYDKLGNSLA